MKKDSFMIKDDRNLCKSHFGCYFRLSLVNFKKKKKILFLNIWVIYGSGEHQKSDLLLPYLK